MTTTPPEKWWMTAPKVCIPLLPADPITGPEKGLNTAWEGDVLPIDGGEPVYCAFKHVNHPGKLAVEMACALVAAVLGNKVPKPCLVRVEPGQLPALPQSAFKGPTALLFGSTYVGKNGFFEQLAQASDATLDNSVWQHFCSDAPMAAKGASLDELLANWDRHSRNMRFDGRAWWLIDHDNALASAVGKDAAALDASFKAHKNHIADQLGKRRSTDHQMENAARLTAGHHQTVMSLAARAAQWTDPDPLVANVWQQTAPLIELLSRRLPMLQALIGARIGATQPTELQWSTPPQPPTPPTS